VTEKARLERSGDIAELIIDSPPLNLFDDELVAALETRLTELTADPPRALIFRAEGEIVSGGVNVETFRGLDKATADEFTARLMAMAHALEDLPLPTLAVAHGLCLTAAFELSLACDLLWAGEGVQFGLVERVVGITPLMGGTQRMAERAGTARAREFVMTGNLYDAETLHSWGVVNRVLAPEELLQKARHFAERLAAGPTQAHAATKRIVRVQADLGTRGADERTARLTSHLFETNDTRQAIESFLSDGPGKATFTGK
jgi:enoyl-CoA hydratase/carnithine racemase